MSENYQYKREANATAVSHGDRKHVSLLWLFLRLSDAEEDKINTTKDPELVLTFHRNKDEYPEIQVSYYPCDDSNDLVEVNGNRYFLVNSDDINNLKKSIEKAF